MFYTVAERETFGLYWTATYGPEHHAVAIAAFAAIIDRLMAEGWRLAEPDACDLPRNAVGVLAIRDGVTRLATFEPWRVEAF